MRLLPIALLLTAGLAAGGAPAAPEESRALRIMIYNIHHGEGMDGVVDLERIAAIILAEAPDIVCLQEVDRGMRRTSGKDFPARFAELLDMTAVFEPNLLWDGGEYGNATFTRLPIVEHENLRLPNPDLQEPRGALRVTIRFEEQEIDVWNTHFGLSAGERREQAEALRAALRDRPTIVCGDLNENEQGSGVAHLLETLGNTIEKNEGETEFTIPSRNPRRRIDFILVSPHFETLRSAVIFDERTQVASDHLPYHAELRLREAE